MPLIEFVGGPLCGSQRSTLEHPTPNRIESTPSVNVQQTGTLPETLLYRAQHISNGQPVPRVVQGAREPVYFYQLQRPDPPQEKQA